MIKSYLIVFTDSTFCSKIYNYTNYDLFNIIAGKENTTNPIHEMVHTAFRNNYEMFTVDSELTTKDLLEIAKENEQEFYQLVKENGILMVGKKCITE
jgi:formylmethanofuran dehydrogenase subunit A